MTAFSIAPPALAKSPGTMTGRTSMLALNARNQGSAIAGICEACGRNTSDAVTFRHDGSRHRQRGPGAVPARSEDVVSRKGSAQIGHPEPLPPRIWPTQPLAADENIGPSSDVTTSYGN